MSNAKLLAALVLVVTAVGSAPYAAAFLYNISHICGDNCLSGTEATWNVTLHKGAGLPIEVSKVEILESNSKEQLGLYNDSTVMVYSQNSFLINGTLPSYRKPGYINVTPCFTTLIGTGRGSRIIDDVFIGLDRTYCEKINYSTPLLQCMALAQCAATESCTNNTCSELKCGQCQYIANHSCARYECCSDAECSPNKACQNNTCAPLNCPQRHKAENHTCTEIVCKDDEAIKSDGCEPLNCSESEAAKNHTCAKLECGKGEAAKNHLCVKIVPEPAKPQQENNAAAGNNASSGNSSSLLAQPQAAYKLLEVLLLGTILGIAILFANTFYIKHKP